MADNLGGTQVAHAPTGRQIATRRDAINEAGGKLVDDTTGKELRYNKESLLNPHFIAYGEVREELLAC